MIELRASVSLGRLWQSQGKSQQAYQLVKTLYDWFSEGFDSVDLRHARALLDSIDDVTVTSCETDAFHPG